MNGLKIFIFVLVVLAFYSYVGSTVPQKITYPPETADLSGDLTPVELAAIGEDVVAGKGTCLTCHTIGSGLSSESLRFPDLGGVGAEAGSRVEGLSDVEYLAQSLYDPNAYIVEGFLAGMPPIHRPPINLSDQEILAVIAYLQSLGGTPSVTLDTELEGQSAENTGASAPATTPTGTQAAAPGAGLDGAGVFAAYMCATCHAIDTDERRVGPSLFDVGTRLSRAQIYESIMEPDAELAEGYPGAVMPATLNASGFYQKVSTEELKSLVDYLASKTGN